MADADYFAALARNYEALHLLMGMTYEFSSFRSHAETQLPFDPESSDLLLPRATIGIDYFASEFSALLEYHFNGFGFDGDYLAAQTDPRIRRGESYLLGRHYLGLTLAYLPIPELTLAASSIANVADPSALVTTTASYSLSENTSVVLGGYFGLGKHPTIVPQFSVPSEFGAAGISGFLQISGFL